MADSGPSAPSAAPLPVPLASKENLSPVGSKITELNESRSELLSRIQGLKQDLQSWRSKLDTQVKVYRNELEDLKKSLNVEVEQLRTEFQDLRSTLQQQQEDVSASLRNLGLQDISADASEAQSPRAESTDKEVNVAKEEVKNKEGEIFE